MGSANLEVVKFGFYMFFPIVMMFKFGDPEWYKANVQPYKEIIWPPYESTHKPPHSSEELHSELERLKAERLAKRANAQSSVTQELGGAGILDDARRRAASDRMV